MAVSSTTGIHDDLHLQPLGSQVDARAQSPVRDVDVAAPQQAAGRAPAASLDGEAVLALDVWQGAAHGSRTLGAPGLAAPATAGLAPHAAIDASAAHVLAALG